MTTMDSMDYNYFSSGPQAYQYLGYGSDNGMLQGGVSNDASGVTQVSTLASRVQYARDI